MKLSHCRRALSTISNSAAAVELLQLNQTLAHLNRSHSYTQTLHLFNQINSSPSLKPDHYTLSSAITASAKLRHVVFGNQLHAAAIRCGLKSFPHVANPLLSLYATTETLDAVLLVFDEIVTPDVYTWTTLLSACLKLGAVEYAFHVFDEMPDKSDVAVWNAVITGCAENGDEVAAFGFFREMRGSGVNCDRYSVGSVLSFCCFEGIGRQVHCLAVRIGLLGRGSVVNALLTMYFNCWSVAEAFEVFEEAGEDGVLDEISFNVMIDGLVGAGRSEEGLVMFKGMRAEGMRPTELTFVSVMSSVLDMGVAKHVYAQVVKMGFEAFTAVSNAAITMYSRCGDCLAAHLVFESLEERDVISWNAMIAAFAQVNDSESAFLVYLQMHRKGEKPDEFTYGSLLASSLPIETVQMIQAVAHKNGLILKIQVSNAMVSAYAKQGQMNLACLTFEDTKSKNLITWNAIISGFLLNGMVNEGLEQFHELLMSEISPDVYTLSIVLSMCASISSLRDGKPVHAYIFKFGFSQRLCLGNALITMYGKCGILDLSVRVFEAMNEKDIISWNSLISAYAQHGRGREAVDCFEAMQELSSITPDQATFTAVLSACSHAGLVDDGTRIFNSMISTYKLMPEVDHFSCIVDLLGRAGYLDEAETVINSKEIEAHPNIWWTLISSCAAHGNLRLGRIVAGYLLETEENNSSVYVLLASIYAVAGQWEEAANMRELMNRIGEAKTPGCSWINS